MQLGIVTFMIWSLSKVKPDGAYYGISPKKCLKFVIEEVFWVLFCGLLVGYDD